MIHGCQDVVRIWQNLAKTAKMLVRESTRVVAATIYSIYCMKRRHATVALYKQTSFFSTRTVRVLRLSGNSR